MSQFFDDLKQARIAKHPIHSMLIHFPSALFPASLLFDFLSAMLQNYHLSYASFYCLTTGLLSGIVAAFAGAIDYSNLSSKSPAWNKASLHGLLNGI